MRLPKGSCYIACELCHHCEFMDDLVDRDNEEMIYCNFHKEPFYPDDYCDHLYHVELPLLKAVK